ncbi:OmpA family protein [Bosea sp. (in: a-proteobacteria)]|jgi:outer membrane protein OmpA-like peptidoglycan-associated protein|uniref:OmpA family protein n=1 Tax=Bosea sp. (in: a-proteobacteria) TaxID=1871050 RepID=UPI002DDC92E1|nr:OmpA family protein [Bosea sp. (in: a-proteobacteria)]HEV2512997.1 OmpA family protein [Bosea sp. (in: a-proteobacteria)]
MARQAGWLWGLVPLSLVWAAANALNTEPVRRDIEARALAASAVAGSASGARSVSIRVSGRDVYLDGEAVTADGASKALAQLQSEFGVRRVLGGLTQVIAQRPYSWSATRQGNLVTLSGFVPDEATAMATLAAARALDPGLKVDDQQKVSFGAPVGFAELAALLMGDLGQLSIGKVGLDDSRYCVEGTAATPQSFQSLRERAASASPKGFTRVDCPLSPATVSPYRWSAEKSASGAVTVSGYYPSDAARREIGALLGRAFPSAGAVNDRMLQAAGEPPAFASRVARAVADLARLRSGKAELDGAAYRISGQGPDGYEACEALKLNIAQGDGPDSVALASVTCPPSPPPVPKSEPAPAPSVDVPPTAPATPSAPAPASQPSAPVNPAPAAPAPAAATEPQPAPLAAPRPLQWRAEKSENGIVLSGTAPDAAARAAVLEAARAALSGGEVVDRTVVESGPRGGSDYGEAARFALGLLGKMAQGSVSLAGSALSLTGAAADKAGWQALEEALKGRALPAGLSLSGRPALTLRSYGFSASIDKSGGYLNGYLPDAAAKDAIAALIEASPLRGRVSDETEILPAAPTGFGVAARGVVQDLLRLDLGSASVVDREVNVRGLTCRALIRDEVQTNLASGLPDGFSGKAEIGMRQTGCVIDPPSNCQNELDALTQRYYVMFGQGTAVVTLDPVTERAMTEAAAILKQCPTSRVTIEGHANLDGERSGFNNLDLSNRRALRVREELIRRGIGPVQLEVKGYGTDRPLVAHGDPEARVKNRRVQFTVAK